MCDILQPLADEIDEIAKHLKDGTSNMLDEDTKPTLLSMPVEIFLKICSFIDAEFLSVTLSKVCRRFEDILNDSTLWQYWVSRRIKQTYPALPHLRVWDENEINWRVACIDLDKETRKWSNVSETMKHVVVKDVHFASVDSVLLVNNGELCLSGGRDRGLALWNVASIKKQDECENNPFSISLRPTKMLTDAHLGWIWDLAADSLSSATVAYTASWDNTLKAWDLSRNLECIETFKCGMSALSVVCNGDIIMAGLYSRKVLMFDIRVGPNAVDEYKTHKGPVLALKTLGHKVASLSEDKTLAVWDQRAKKAIASDVKMPGNRAYPVCLNWTPTALYIGDSKGSLHLIDPEEYVNRGTHEIWSEPPSTLAANKITGIHQGPGSMIVCSDRGEIKCLYPSFPPKEYTTLRSTTHDITKLQYQNEILAIGTCDSALEFWIPLHRYEES